MHRHPFKHTSVTSLTSRTSHAEWLTEAATRKRLNVVSCHLVSSHSGEGVAMATGKICRERKGRDVYVIGAANVSMARSVTRGVDCDQGCG